MNVSKIHREIELCKHNVRTEVLIEVLHIFTDIQYAVILMAESNVTAMGRSMLYHKLIATSGKRNEFMNYSHSVQ